MAGMNMLGSSAGAAPGGQASSMMAMMRNCCGQDARTPLFAALMRLPGMPAEQRQQVAAQAHDRLNQGLALLTQGARDARRASTPLAMSQAGERARDGLSLFDSGAAAQAALSGQRNPQTVALNWFRDELSLPEQTGQHGDSLFGLTPQHLLLMTVLLLVSGGLLVLQLLRLRRVRELMSAGIPPAAGAASARVSSPPSTVIVPLAPPTLQPASTPAAVKSDIPPSNSPAPGGTALRRPRTWAGELRVARIIRETPTIETFRLVEPSADRLPFDFLPGQFLQVEVEPEPGKPVRRSYTIASSPTQRAYVELTVKREEQGVVSRYLHDNVKVGDRIKVSGPFGTFTFTGSDAESIVLIAGGVGITPMMSVLRYLTDTAWPGEIFFVYGARSTDEFVFRWELEQLERRHERLHVFATMQRTPGTVWFGPEGLLTQQMLEAAVPDIVHRRVHLCGPPPMMTAVKRLLTELGVPEAQIHSEAFGPASLPLDDAPEAVTSAEPAVVASAAGTVPSAAPPSPPQQAQIASTTVTFSISGVSAALPAEQTVLEAAEGAGVEIPFVCRIGECGVCVTHLLQGEVRMAVETGLDPADKAQGYVLACQAKGTGVPLVVEA